MKFLILKQYRHYSNAINFIPFYPIAAEQTRHPEADVGDNTEPGHAAGDHVQPGTSGEEKEATAAVTAADGKEDDGDADDDPNEDEEEEEEGTPRSVHTTMWQKL